MKFLAQEHSTMFPAMAEAGEFDAESSTLAIRQTVPPTKRYHKLT